MPTTRFTWNPTAGTGAKSLAKGRPTPAAGFTVSLNARPDRVDLRDRLYQPKLVNLPPNSPDPAMFAEWLPAYRKLILNQGNEGACTGFGLAAVVNYLIFRENRLHGRSFDFDRVSPGMLYRLARIYDEWPGDDYEGSSCRGAMKGWHKHGICSWDAWPYQDSAPDAGPRAGSGWEAEAGQVPLGAYYRVLKELVNDMQSAIHEVGAIYVSAEVHAGWELVPASSGGKPGKLPVIPFKPGMKATGGHAFALVGYTGEGFIVQNSWGPKWGRNGFAILTYEDWLEHGADAWVAVMGAPRSGGVKIAAGTAVRAADNPALAARPAGITLPAGAKHPGVWDGWDTLRHTVILGNNGRPERRNVAHANGAEAVTAAARDEIVAWLAGRKDKVVKVALYAHGGLNSEEASLKRVAIMGPWFEINGVYPLFFTWKTGAMETIGGMLQDAVGRFIGVEPAGGILDHLKKQYDKVVAALAAKKDTWLESICHEILVRAAWTEMKSNAAAAAAASGGIALAAIALGEAAAEARKLGKTLELHLIGHSAGSILLGHALNAIAAGSSSVRSLHLFAPACTVQFACEHYLPAMAKGGILHPGTCETRIHNLTHAAEMADTVGPYGKSLVYLICRALEQEHKTPILGMQAAWKDLAEAPDVFNRSQLDHVAQWRKGASFVKPKYYGLGDEAFNGAKPETPKHGTFDNDIATINATLEVILGRVPPRQVTWLAGY